MEATQVPINRQIDKKAALAGVALLVGGHHEWKNCGFDSQSGCMPGLRVWSPSLGAYKSSPGHIQDAVNVSLSHSCFSPFLSPYLPLSLKSVSMSSGED